MHNIVHVEIPATDMARAKKFYGQIFGWKFVDFDPTYSLFNPTGRGVGGGIYKVDTVPTQSPVRAYVLVDSVDATISKVNSAGGTIVHQKGEVPGMGWYAGFKDPQGAEVWVWQRSPRRQTRNRRSQTRTKRTKRTRQPARA
ncbi:MAG TPA: VOC family protein [bacterium]|nr:VOC family protein [bacterium]